MFTLIPQSELSEKHFELYPVWSEHYDHEEIEEIVDWGVNRDWLLKQIKDKCTGNEHCVYPVLQTNPLPERMRIFIKAAFQTPNRVSLSGFVVNEDAYCISIFFENEQYLFNNHPLAQDLNEAEETKLESVLRQSIFPLSYETDFHNRDGERICGKFSFR